MPVYSPLTTSILLNGVDESVNMGNIATLAFERTVDFTAQIWTKAVGGGNDKIFGKSAGSSGWRFLYGSVEVGGVEWLNRSNLQTANIRSLVSGGAPNINDGEWHHLVGVQHGNDPLPNTDFDLYINAVLMTTGDGTLIRGGTAITSTTLSAAEARVGATNGGGLFYNGNVLHAATWSGLAMTQAQVTELFGNGQPQDLDLTSFAGPNFWLVLGDGDVLGAGGIADHSGGGNNGTLLGGAASNFVLDVPQAGDTGTAITTQYGRGAALMRPTLNQIKAFGNGGFRRNDVA